MNRSNTDLTVSNPIKQGLSGMSAETRQLVSLGRLHRWPFQVLGKAPMIEQPVRLGDWLLVPAQEDSSPIPARTLERIQAIFAAGIRPQGFVLVHEAPRLLKAPAKSKEMLQEQYAPRVETVSSSQSVPDVLSMLGTALSAVASMIFPMLFIVVAAAFADPILVTVMEDGHWIEIDRWWTE